MRQVLCPVLVGREDEVQVLLDGLDRAAGGHGGTTVVVGEAGVGKSRLVREVSRRALASGFSVLTGRAVSGIPTPYRPLAEAVLGGLRHRGGLDSPELAPHTSALGRLLPQWLPRELAATVESPVVLGEGLLRLLRVLEGERGCLLVLEDLHWADPESLAVLEYLADNVAGERIVCLGTLRALQEGAGRELIGRLVDRRVARMVELARLGDEATVGLARACLGAGALPAEVEALLCASADGLPFLVEELLAGWWARGCWSNRTDAGRPRAGSTGGCRQRSRTRWVVAWASCRHRPVACSRPPRCSAGTSTGRCCRRSPGWPMTTWSPRCDRR